MNAKMLRKTTFNLYLFPIGPVLGSLIYEIGGFALPFYIVGGIVLLLAFALSLIVPNVKPGSLAKGHEKTDDAEKPSLTIKNVVTVSTTILDAEVLFENLRY